MAERKDDIREIFDNDRRALEILRMKDGRFYKEVLFLMKMVLGRNDSMELPGRAGKKQTWVRPRGDKWEEMQSRGERGLGIKVEPKPIEEQDAVVQVIRAIVYHDRW